MKKTNPYIFNLILIIFFCFTSCEKIEEFTHFQIQGTIIDGESGETLGGVKIKLMKQQGWNSSSGLTVTSTGGNGNYHINHDVEGECYDSSYYLFAEKNGYISRIIKRMTYDSPFVTCTNGVQTIDFELYRRF